jgi:hypothetical protein
MNEAARLDQIRRSLSAIAPAKWSLVADDEGCFVETRGPMGELLPVMRFHPGASADEMQFATDAPAMVSFLLDLVDRAIRKLRQPADKSADEPARREAAKDFAAEAAMKCQDPAFRVFLEERHGLERPLTPERVAQKVRSLLGVVSRAELNTNDEAAKRWKALRGDFDAWKRSERR